MDKLCRLSSPTPDALTEFALSCLELGDEVSSCNILQYFSKVLGYETFLRPFDQRKGIHAVLKVARATIDSAPGAGSRGIAKNVAKYCACALRNYLRAHLLLAAGAISIRVGLSFPPVEGFRAFGQGCQMRLLRGEHFDWSKVSKFRDLGPYHAPATPILKLC